MSVLEWDCYSGLSFLWCWKTSNERCKAQRNSDSCCCFCRIAKNTRVMKTKWPNKSIRDKFCLSFISEIKLLKDKYFRYSIVIDLFRLSAYRSTMPGINVLDKWDFVLDQNDKTLSLRSVSATCILWQYPVTSLKDSRVRSQQVFSSLQPKSDRSIPEKWEISPHGMLLLSVIKGICS